jgi:hypothetical protein
MNRWIWLVAAAGWMTLAATAALAADTERDIRPNPNGLPAILERIQALERSGDWKADGWTDPAIEKWLENAAKTIATAADRADYELPVKFADVRAAAPGARIRGLEGGVLVVGSDVNVAHARRHIILADGNADVSFADHCIIIARGVVSVSHCNNSLIVSGTLVEISHDGNGFGGMPAGSIVLCRGRADIGHAKGTCVLGHEGVEIAHAHGVTFFGAAPTTSHRDGVCKVLKVPPSFPVEPRSAHALEKKIEVLGSVRPKGLVFRFDSKRYFASLNEEIVNEAGEKVPGLDGWRVTFVGDESAAISSGSIDVPLRLPKN